MVNQSLPVLIISDQSENEPCCVKDTFKREVHIRKQRPRKVAVAIQMEEKKGKRTALVTNKMTEYMATNDMLFLALRYFYILFSVLMCLRMTQVPEKAVGLPATY